MVTVAEVPKGYKKTEAGIIPEDWEAEPIGNSLEFKNGLNKAKEFFGKGTPIVNYMDVFSNAGLLCSDIDGKVTLTSDEIRNYQVKKGDVFFTRTSETVDEIGISSVMLEDIKDAVFSGFVLRGRSKNDNLHLLYKKYCFRFEKVRKQICSTSSYTTRALTNGRLLSKVFIAVPPQREEQESIARVLSDIDILIVRLEGLITKKQNIKQGTMQELLTGKKRLPGFSGEWEGKKLGEIFSLSATCSKTKFIVEGGAYFIMDMGAISSRGQIITSKKTFISADLLKIGDLIMPKDDIGGGNIIGKVAYINESNKYVLGDHVYKLTAKTLTVDTLFLSYLINSYAVNSGIRKKVAGSAQLGLGRKSVEDQDVKIPKEKPEQSAIAQVLSDMDSEIDGLEQKLDKYKMIKQGMMQVLLTGKTRLL